MQPGQYEFTGTIEQTGGNLVGSGVTLYVAPSASPIQLGGNGVSLSAPTSGSYANVLYYQDPSNTALAQFTSTNTSVTGLVYAPAATGQVNANISSYVVLVFANMNFDGTSCGGWNLAGPTAGNSIIQTAVLGN